MAKVSFDGQNKTITVLPGVTEIDVQRDIYSTWKDWVFSGDGAKWQPAIRTTGGDAINQEGTQFAPKFFFLINGWKIIVNNGLTVSVQLNLYTDNLDGVIYSVSNGSNVNAKLSDAVVVSAEGSGLADILNILQQFTFKDGDVVATLDGERVSTDDESRRKSKADIWAL